jgi:hypothetical protein
VLACSTAVGCFTGADALGLPCNEDKDCGIDLACREGFCGGPPAGSETSTTMGTSTTTESSSSAETGIPECAAQPGDSNFCMPADPGTDDENCNFDCTVSLCGDGHVYAAAGEACELPVPGESTCVCDAMDCTSVVCGDEQVNELAGEECDQGVDAEEYDQCTPQCRTNTFGDLLDDTSWVVETEGFTDGWTHETGEWWSGDYDILNQTTDPDRAVAGVTRLVSPEIAIPEAGADPLVLRFRHRYDFDPYCDRGELAQADGGRVELWAGGAPIAWPESDAVYPDVLVDQCTDIAAPVNPLGAVPAFAGVANDLADVEIPLPAAAYGATVQIVFLAGFDCGLCDVDDVPDGWRIDAVRIGPAVAGTCDSG